MAHFQLSPVIFFDIGETLGRVESTSAGSVRLELFPYVPAILDRLQAAGVLMGIISNTGQLSWEVLTGMLVDAGVLGFFAEQLLIFSSLVRMDKSSPRIFAFAAECAGRSEAPNTCCYVGENAQERQFAAQAGLDTADDPRHLPTALDSSRPGPFHRSPSRFTS